MLNYSKLKNADLPEIARLLSKRKHTIILSEPVNRSVCPVYSDWFKNSSTEHISTVVGYQTERVARNNNVGNGDLNAGMDRWLSYQIVCRVRVTGSHPFSPSLHYHGPHQQQELWE